MTHAATCSNCRSTDILVVALTPGDTPMMFNTCRHCENCWWEAVDAATATADVDLTEVLESLSA